MKLNMGCGPDKREGWINVDIRKEMGDVQHDMAHMPYPFPNEFAEEILFNHSMEHLPFNAHGPIMSECHRILKGGGTLTICVPDLRDFVKHFIHYLFETSYTADEAKRIDDAREFWGRFNTVINGEQLHPNDMHISTFDYGYYLMMLKDCGFDTVKESYDGRGLVVTATKGEK
jgi:predicted SAM-dependent methyltransferase